VQESVYKPSPGEAFESESGNCPEGGPHKWRFGKCRQCGLGEGYGKIGHDGGNKNNFMKRTCNICKYTWMDKYRKQECPKCTCPLNLVDPNTFKLSPLDALESESGDCPKGGSHSWRFGRCRECGIGQGYGEHGADGGCENPFLKRQCPRCTFEWQDKYRKDECPKCFLRLSSEQEGANLRKKTWRPGDAPRSESGECTMGGPHSWKYGRCGKCGVGEGYAKHRLRNGPQNPEERRQCPTCTYSWLDRHRRNECPKCLRRLKMVYVPPRPQTAPAAW